MSQAEHIAVVLPSWVGDVVMATPALRALREHFADARLTFIGRPVALELLRGQNQLADAELVDDRGAGWRLLTFWRLVGAIRRSRFDLTVLLPNSFRSALMCKLGRARRLVGYDRDGRGWMLAEKLQAPRDETGRFTPIPQVTYYNALAERVDAKVESREMSLPVDAQAEAAADKILRGAGVDFDRPIVTLNPGGSFGPSKLWPAERYAAVADELASQRGAQIIINAAPGEHAIAAAGARPLQAPPLINLADQTNSISLVKSLLKRSTLLITNDTGARHVAAAMGASIVTIFGSTDPTWAKIDYPRERIVRVNVPCAPCQKAVCPLPAGPGYHRCMAEIGAQQVLAAALELLDQPAAVEGGP